MQVTDLHFAGLRRIDYSGLAFSALLDRRARPRIDPGGVGMCLDDLAGLSIGQMRIEAAVASTADQLVAAAALVESRYAWRGYVLHSNDSPLPSGVTLIATQDAATLGTLTLRVDGPAGLAADESFREAIDAARECGRRVCELTRLAIDAAADWRPTFGVLIELAFLVGRVLHEATDVFIEVNPRHERFYQKMFGFVVAAGRRVCPRVEAPAVLLRLELERLEAILEELGVLPAFGTSRARAGGVSA